MTAVRRTYGCASFRPCWMGDICSRPEPAWRQATEGSRQWLTAFSLQGLRLNSFQRGQKFRYTPAV